MCLQLIHLHQHGHVHLSSSAVTSRFGNHVAVAVSSSPTRVIYMKGEVSEYLSKREILGFCVNLEREVGKCINRMYICGPARYLVVSSLVLGRLDVNLVGAQEDLGVVEDFLDAHERGDEALDVRLLHRDEALVVHLHRASVAWL